MLHIKLVITELKHGWITFSYDCSFVEPSPVKLDTECPICHQILREPHQVACCGKICCQSCITKALDENSCCPLCNVVQPQHWLDKNRKQTLSDLAVFCLHHPFCKWKGELGAIDSHIDKDCQLVVVPCQFKIAGCKVELPRKDMTSHLKMAISSHVRLLCSDTNEHLQLFASCLEVIISMYRAEIDLRKAKIAV